MTQNELFEQAWLNATEESEIEVAFINSLVRVSNGQFSVTDAHEFFKKRYAQEFLTSEL